MFEEFGINAGYVEDLHTLWRQAPQSVDARWREFFEGGAPSPVTAAAPAPAPAALYAPAAYPSALPSNGNGNGHGNGHAAVANGNGMPAPALARGRNGVGGMDLTPPLVPSILALANDSMLETAGVQGRVFQLINAYRVR